MIREWVSDVSEGKNVSLKNIFIFKICAISFFEQALICI